MIIDIDGEATIQQIGPPERVIDAFGPEVVGENVEGKVLAMETAEYSGRTYYQFELESPHALITAAAAGNRLYLFNVTGSGDYYIKLQKKFQVSILILLQTHVNSAQKKYFPVFQLQCSTGNILHSDILAFRKMF